MSTDHPARPGVPPNRNETHESALALARVLEAANRKEFHENAQNAARAMDADVRASALGRALDAAVRVHLPLILARLKLVDTGDDPVAALPPGVGFFLDRTGRPLEEGDIVATTHTGRIVEDRVVGLWVKFDQGRHTGMVTVAGVGHVVAADVQLLRQSQDTAPLDSPPRVTVAQRPSASLEHLRGEGPAAPDFLTADTDVRP